MSDNVPASVHRQIAALASLTAVHRAFRWLHLHQPQLRQWQMEMLAIPAPTFSEGARAAWFLERFRALGLTNVHLDEAGNALAELAPADADATRDAEPAEDKPSVSPPMCVLLSAHLDTVFPAGTPSVPAEDGSRILCPGACDNAAGLTALLGIAAALRHANIPPPLPILFAANVGEEGEGDLRGMRQLFLADGTGCTDLGAGRQAYKGRIVTALALEGSGSGTVVTRALGSRRFRLTATGPGGHSWSDAGVVNPIFVLSRVLAAVAAIALPESPKTVLSAGQIAGGTSVNSIPEQASALLDLRSTDAAQLLATEAALRHVVEVAASAPGVTIAIETIGDRPTGELAKDAPLLHTIRAVDRHLALRTEVRLGSTDANLPLSLGVPAVALGAGGSGGGIHTLQEWYDPSGRESALQRILLILLATLQQQVPAE